MSLPTIHGTNSNKILDFYEKLCSKVLSNTLTIQAINEAAIQATYQTASIYKFSSKSTWSKKKTTRLLRPAKPLIEKLW